MPAELPNLSGVATKDLVEHIGSGNFKASYINWSRTMELLRKHAPGWMIETVFSPEGGPLHKAPQGAFLLLRFRHLDGTVTPEVPQAIMDHRNSSIAYDRITSRDITDTHRRGSCLLAAFQMGLAYELWAKMPLESGYQVEDQAGIEKVKATVKNTTKAASAASIASAEPAETTLEDFLKACSEKGLTSAAAKSLVPKLNGDFANGVKTIQDKDAAFVAQMNSKFPDTPGEDY